MCRGFHLSQIRHNTRYLSPSYDNTRKFEVPAYAKKKERQRENRHHKIITGKSQTNNANFRGAPEGNRDLFIFRVHPDTVCTDIEQLLVDIQCEVRNLDCVSNPNSRFKSYPYLLPILVRFIMKISRGRGSQYPKMYPPKEGLTLS